MSHLPERFFLEESSYLLFFNGRNENRTIIKTKKYIKKCFISKLKSQKNCQECFFPRNNEIL